MTELTGRLTSALADRYLIERELGQGGMATVYLAADLKHDRKVALKVLRPELAAVLGAERFVAEIKTTASLQHPHILPLFDSGTADGFLYYVMPYIEGETLRDKLSHETQLSIEAAVRIATEVADALDYAHRHGVIHRDIKPENILLHDGRPMVADFGIALAVSAAAGGRMTETGLSLGTPHYMSPEQATGEKDITARSDVYSLASVLYELLTGNPPHVGASAQQIIMKIVTEEAAPVTKLRKSVPPHVTAALAKGLEKLPADRFESAKAFADALGNPAFTTAAMQREAAPRAERARLVTWGGWVAAAVLLVAAVLLARPTPAEPRQPTRLHVALPGGLSQRQFGNDLAIGPDGRTLAYTSRNARDVPTLFVKRGDELEASEVPGTEGAAAPFFSPDGATLGFVRSSFYVGSLEVIALSGGAPQVLVDSGVTAAGAGWGPDGFVYASSASGGLVRVPASGGSAEEILAAERVAELGALGAANPFPLPNGNGVLFTLWDPNGNSDVGVLDLRSGAVRVVTRGLRPVFLPTGHVVLTLGATLQAVPFDQDRLALTGPSVTLVTRMGLDRTMTFGEYAISNGGTLVYEERSDSGTQRVVRVGRDGVTTELDPDWSGVGLGMPAVSPDGSRMAVSVDGSIWVKVLDRGPLTRLTFGDGQDSRPMWHPDGRRILFYRNRGALGDTIFSQRADGVGTAEVLVADERGAADARWSADGQWLVYRTSMETPGAGDIKALEAGDTTPTSLLTGAYSEMTPALSPDGHWLAYASDESGRYEVYVRPFPDVEGGRWQVSSSGGVQPVWSRNGRELFFRSDDDAMMVAQVATDPVFSLGTVRRLFSTEGFEGGVFAQQEYDVLPDGDGFMMISAPGGESEPVVMVFDWFEELRARVPAGRSRAGR